jgi:hypothetical protein
MPEKPFRDSRYYSFRAIRQIQHRNFNCLPLRCNGLHPHPAPQIFQERWPILKRSLHRILKSPFTRCTRGVRGGKPYSKDLIVIRKTIVAISATRHRNQIRIVRTRFRENARWRNMVMRHVLFSLIAKVAGLLFHGDQNGVPMAGTKGEK